MKMRAINPRSRRQFYVLTMLFLSILTALRAGGLDSYEVYLNDKLVMKQYINQPLNLRQLQLNKVKDSDVLRIRYNHCNTPNSGTGRSLFLKGADGVVLKKWEFSNVNSTDKGMVVSVKELRQLERQNKGRELSMYYAARELTTSEMLAVLHF